MFFAKASAVIIEHSAPNKENRERHILLRKEGDPSARSRTDTLLTSPQSLITPSEHPSLTVRPATSGATNSWWDGRCVQDRERIHRDIADSRLLAIPTSYSSCRVQSELRIVF